MAFRALILGASGYGGGELLRLLRSHPACEGVRGTSRKLAGKPFEAAHPNLTGTHFGCFDAEPDLAWLSGAEGNVLFAALPHGVFAETYPTLNLPAGTIVIDLSGDHRLRDAELFARSYGKTHPHPEGLSHWTYGLTEICRESIRHSDRIANPGCFATAINLGIWPLLDLDIKEISISAITGSSGSGAEPIEATHHPTRAHDFRAYKVLGHQHGGEIEQLCEGRLNWSFVPMSGPFVRGIFATLQFRSEHDVAQAFRDRYAHEPFIHLLDRTPRTETVAGTNRVEIQVVQKESQVAVMVALDNLGKGMASQAIQNLNVRLGIAETTGIDQVALYPA